MTAHFPDLEQRDFIYFICVVGVDFIVIFYGRKIQWKAYPLSHTPKHLDECETFKWYVVDLDSIFHAHSLLYLPLTLDSPHSRPQ